MDPVATVVFLIPELASAIAEYINRNDLLSCGCVCSDWSGIFIPLFWSFFVVPLSLSTADHHVPQLVHASCMCQCCLAVRVLTRNAKYIHRIRYPSIASNSPALPPFRTLFNIIATNCTSLRSVDVYSYSHNSDGVPGVVATWFASLPNLRTLSTDVLGLLVASGTAMSRVLDFSTIRHLALHVLCHTMLRMPLLQSLTLFGITGTHSDVRLVALLPLTSLTIQECPKIAAMRRLLQNIQARWLRTLRIGDPTVETLHAIMRPLPHDYGHGQTLQYIHFIFGTNKNYDAPVVVFAHCHALETLRMASYSPANWTFDLRELIGQPWVCTRLKRLEMPMVLNRHCRDPRLLAMAGDEKRTTLQYLPEWQQAETVFMRRLGMLVELEQLVLLTATMEGHRNQLDMSIRLDAGLLSLAGLNRLRLLDLGHQRCHQGTNDIQWMRGHLTSLRTLRFGRIDDLKLLVLTTHFPELTVERLAA